MTDTEEVLVQKQTAVITVTRLNTVKLKHTYTTATKVVLNLFWPFMKQELVTE